MAFFIQPLNTNAELSFYLKGAWRHCGSLTDIVFGLPALRDSASMGEVRAEILRSYNDLIERHLQPTGQEFIEGVADALLRLVKDYEFLVQVEGLDLKGQDALELGAVRIQRADRSLLEKVRFEGSLDLDWIYEQFKDKLWLIVPIKGSPDVASERVEYRATLTVGLLAICGASYTRELSGARASGP